MKAVVMTGVGGPEVLAVKDIPAPPAPGPGQLLVRVKAAGVNPIDYKIRKSGHMGYGAGHVLGFDAAGIVENIGPGVSDFKSGDRVFYSPEFTYMGAYAQLNLVQSKIVAHIPTDLSFEEAAAIPVVGQTAWDGLFTRGQLALGQTAFIAAANGGVGSIALQMAKAAGAYVFATASSRSADFVRSIPRVGGAGPDRLLNYQTDNWSEMIKAECPSGLDFVYDCAGQDVVSRCIPLMKPLGRIVTIVNPAGKLDEAYRHNVAIHYQFILRKRSTLEILRTLLERRQLTALIDCVMKLDQAADAHRKLEAGGVRGKIILQVE
jgi:NADPH:quinone reductase